MASEQDSMNQSTLPAPHTVVSNVAVQNPASANQQMPVAHGLVQFPSEALISPAFQLSIGPYLCLPPVNSVATQQDVSGPPEAFLNPTSRASEPQLYAADSRLLPDGQQTRDEQVAEMRSTRPFQECAEHNTSGDLRYRDRVLDDDVSREQFDKKQMKEKVEQWKIRDGHESDRAEFERLRTPHKNIIDAELAEVLHRRVVIIRGLTMEELGHHRVLEIMSRSNEFRLTFVFKENAPADANDIPNEDEPLWEGMMILFMPSVHDATEAAKYAQGIRQGLSVRFLQPDEDIGNLVENWRDSVKSLMRQVSDDVMIVSQLSESVTKDELHEMFPDALDIVLPRNRIASQDSEKLNAKGYAFLTFGSRPRMAEAYTRYSSSRLLADGHVVRVIKYEPPKIVPFGYLRLKRRHRILCIIRDLKTAKMYAQHSDKVQADKLQCHASYWEELVEKDDEIRQDLGLSAPSVEELQLLLGAAVPSVKPWTDDDIKSLLKRSTFERSELDELKEYHKARFAGAKRRRLQRMSERPGRRSHEGPGYFADGFPETGGEQHPPWVPDGPVPHWQHARPMGPGSPPLPKRPWHQKSEHVTSRRRGGWDHRASIRRATATVRRT